MKSIKNIIRILLSLTLHPEEFWQYLATEAGDDAKPDKVQSSYFLPLLGYMSLVTFLCAAFRSPEETTFDYQYGMMQMVQPLTAYFLGPFISILLLPTILGYFKSPVASKDCIQLFVYYSTSFLMALEMLTALIPSIRFISFIVVYLLYITFSGMSTYVPIAPTRRWITGFMSFFVIWAGPTFIMKLMQLLQR